jgi:hypothetical protein
MAGSWRVALGVRVAVVAGLVGAGSPGADEQPATSVAAAATAATRAENDMPRR